MSSDFQEIIKQGYLKVKSKNLGTWNKRWIILKKASSKGGRRLEKFQDEKTSLLQKEDPKPILLSHVTNVSRLPSDVKKHSFALFFSDGTSRQFASESELDADDWHKKISQEMRRGTLTGPEVDTLRNGAITTTDNNEEVFNVYLLPSPNLDIFGECVLQVSPEHINLYDALDLSRKLVSWPLTALRRYGKDESKFTLEAGRHCDTGQGLFIFNTSQGQRIYQKVHSASVAIAEAHRMVSRQEQTTASAAYSKSGGLSRTQSEQPQSTHSVVKSSQSYPGDRAPLPLPRDSPSGSAMTLPPPLPPLDSKRKPLGVDENDYLMSMTTSVQRSLIVQYPSKSSHSPMDTPPRDTPASPPWQQQQQGDDNTDEIYIYEEKYLTKEFKNFLAKRKDDE